MFCRKCGKQLPEGASFCPECGNRITVRQPTQNQATQTRWQPSTAPKTQQPANQTVNISSNITAEYTKLGGWLMFFFVCWILGALGMVISGFSCFSAANTYLKQMSSMSSLLGSSYYSMIKPMGYLIGACGVWYLIYGILAGVLCYYIYKRNPIFLCFYQLTSILMMIIVAIICIAVFAIAKSVESSVGLYGASLDTYSSTLITYGISGIVGLILMTIYFCKSERVRTYMGSSEYMEKALFRIGAK